MSKSLHKLHLHTKPHSSQVSSFSSLFPFFTIKHHFFTTTSLQEPQPPIASHRDDETHNTHLDTTSPRFSGIAKSVLSTCSHLFEKKKELGFAHTSLKDLLLRIFDISPGTARRFRRVSELKPEDVLELLLGFQICCEKSAIASQKVETLWEIFQWAGNQNRDFKHLPRSCEIMASMLIHVRLFREVESLFATLESQGNLLDIHEIFSNLIEGYASDLELERAMSVYNRMREQRLVPPLSCYRVLLDLLVQRSEARFMYLVCMDMVEMRFELSDAEKGTFDNVIRLLCRDGKVMDARNLVMKGLDFGLEPSGIVVNEIARGYCEKKDFEDALRFFTEVRRIPNVLACNKIISSLCNSFGTERAHWFMQELVHLGFVPDEITLGILIGWSCHDGKVRNAFHYLSEIFSRGLTPALCSYNALMSGLFKEGMGTHAKDVLLEMVDRGILPKISTFKVLLAGYCQARQFDDVKVMVTEMANRGLIELSSVEDPLSKAFTMLGFNPLVVRVKRDNHVGLVNTEFFDNLGNGLYLDTDVDEYEKTVAGVLNDSMIPDFNSLVNTECGAGNLKVAIELVEEMARWGQELSLSALSTLLKRLCASRGHIKAITLIMEKVPKLANQLDPEILNLLVQAYSKKGFPNSARTIMDGMLQKHLKITNESYTSLLMGLYNKGELKYFQGYWDLARKENWLPGVEDCKVLVGCLCQQGMLKEALELLESILATCPNLILDVCNVFIEKLCAASYTSIAHELVEIVQRKGYILDHMLYSHLMRGFFKEKRFSKALKVFDIMLANNLAPSLDVSILLIPQLGRNDRIEQALALKEVLLRENPLVSLSVRCALVIGFCKAGEVGEAVDLFKDMLAKTLHPDPEVYNMLVQGHCLANNLSAVEELLGVMIRKNLSLSISSYRKLVQLMCMKGRFLRAFKVKELMLSQSNSAHLITCNILIFYLFQMGNRLLVNTLVDEMQQKGFLLNEITYSFLIYGCCQSRDVSSSKHYLRKMISMEHKPSNRSLRAVISCLCADGELEKALELSQDMELKGWVHGSIIQNVIVEGLLCDGKLQEAENYLDRMVEKGLIPDSINYDNLIKRFCWYRRMNKAVDLLNIMLMKGNIPNSSSYDSLIHGFCLCNKLDRAMDFHIEMLDRNLKPSIKTWDVLVENFCKNGRTAEAEKLLISVLQRGETPTREMYRSVIQRYRHENNFIKASELLQAMQQVGYNPDFETHWSLISKLSSSNENNSSSSPGFLSRLLSVSGFSRKK